MNGRKYMNSILPVALILLGSFIGFALVGSFTGTATAAAEINNFPGNDQATSNYDHTAQLSAAGSDLDIIIDRTGSGSSGSIGAEDQADQIEDTEATSDVSPNGVTSSNDKGENKENIVNGFGQISSVNKTSVVNKKEIAARSTYVPAATARPTETPKITETSGITRKHEDIIDDSIADSSVQTVASPTATPTPTPLPTLTPKQTSVVVSHKESVIKQDINIDHTNDTLNTTVDGDVVDNDSDSVSEGNFSRNSTVRSANGSNNATVSASVDILIDNDSDSINGSDTLRSRTETDNGAMTESRIRQIENNLSKPVAGGAYELWVRYNDAKTLHSYYRIKAANDSGIREYSEFFERYYSERELVYWNRYVSENNVSVNVSNSVTAEIFANGTNAVPAVNISNEVNINFGGIGANGSFVENKSFSNMSQNFEFGITGRGANGFADFSIKNHTWQNHSIDFPKKNWSYNPIMRQSYDWQNWNDLFRSNKTNISFSITDNRSTSDSDNQSGNGGNNSASTGGNGTITDSGFEDSEINDSSNDSVDQSSSNNTGNTTNNTIIVNNSSTVNSGGGTSIGSSGSGTLNASLYRGFYDNWSYEGPPDNYGQRNVDLLEFNGVVYAKWRDGRLSTIGAIDSEAKIKSWGWDVNKIRSVDDKELNLHAFTFPMELGYKPGTTVKVESVYGSGENASAGSGNSQMETWLVSSNNMRYKLSTDNAKLRYQADSTDHEITVLTADTLSRYSNGGEI